MTPRVTPRDLVPLFAAAGLALLLAAPAPGQAVRGTVVDADRGRPLAGAALLLVDSAGAAVDSGRAGPDGGFRLRASAPGEHYIHVQLDGWAGVPSDDFSLAAGEERDMDLRVPLIAARALQQMGGMIRNDELLQRPLEEVCGEELRPWEAGLLVGVVRDRRSREPVAGARVRASGPAGQVLGATLSTERGTYILCNLPGDGPVRVAAETDDGRRGAMEPDIRPGMTAWYDIVVEAPQSPAGARRP